MHIKIIFVLTTFLCIGACNPATPESKEVVSSRDSNIELIVLGTAQDAGYPQIGCQKSCCKNLNDKQLKGAHVVSLGVVDHSKKTAYMFEATPDFVSQTSVLAKKTQHSALVPEAIFITHAHIGHYTGLMFLGKESMDAKDVNVYSLPRFNEFLKTNGPWDQLVKRNNIRPIAISEDSLMQVSDNLSVKTFSVPHRDEYSETAAYIIQGPAKSALFIPDIDKWSKWHRNINELITEVDYAFLDATFYDSAELNNRDMSEIPHPFIVESMDHFGNLSAEEKDKIYFIHFNHTNPVLNKESDAYEYVISQGYHVALEGMEFEL